MTYDWEDTARAEEEAMARVLHYLRSQRTTTSARDVSRHHAYQAMGIDIVLVTSDRSKVMIDVKGDRYPERNFFLETWSVYESRVPGCFLTSKADYWYYYFLRTKTLYLLPLPATRQWFLHEGKPYRNSEKSVPNSGSHGTYTTKGHAIPILAVEDGLAAKGLRLARLTLQ